MSLHVPRPTTWLLNYVKCCRISFVFNDWESSTVSYASRIVHSDAKQRIYYSFIWIYRNSIGPQIGHEISGSRWLARASWEPSARQKEAASCSPCRYGRRRTASSPTRIHSLGTHPTHSSRRCSQLSFAEAQVYAFVFMSSLPAWRGNAKY